MDGIHLDDYFYPTTETAFDAAAFADAKADNLNQFRLSQVNEMIQQIYSTVKTKSPEMLLSISPQGTMDGNYTKQYADVRRWGSEAGYCDVLIPQVYFGFENEAAPFSETVTEWVQTVTCDSVSLVIGIGTHKYGKVDPVSYTHLDVYKRQATIKRISNFPSGKRRTISCICSFSSENSSSTVFTFFCSLSNN